jgi:hypothetical protein
MDIESRRSWSQTLMRLRPAMIVLILLGSSPTRAGQDEPPSYALEKPQIKTGEPLLAFNGKDLTGFYVYTRDHGYTDPNHVFTVRDGLLHVSGEEYGGVATCGNFGNYHLVVEWRWGGKTWGGRIDKARDSGILLHCVGPDGAAGSGWMESIECQIIEGGCGDLLMVGGQGKPRLSCELKRGTGKAMVFEKGGERVTRNSGRFDWWGRDPGWKDVVGFRGRRDVEKPLGEWNRMEVICDGDSITNVVNGFVVNMGTASSATQGKILFQSEGAEIEFRRIEVRPLAK